MTTASQTWEHFFGTPCNYVLISDRFPPQPSVHQTRQPTNAGRDIKGISELKLILPYEISCIKGSSEIPLISLNAGWWSTGERRLQHSSSM